VRRDAGRRVLLLLPEPWVLWLLRNDIELVERGISGLRVCALSLVWTLVASAPFPGVGVARPDSAYPRDFWTFGLLKRLNRDMFGLRGPWIGALIVSSLSDTLPS
jgi:hypothetical protein